MRARARQTTDIWPGFVDALATLLILIIFVLLVFVLGQFFLAQALSGRDAALEVLSGQVSELAEMLSLEKTKNENLVLDLETISKKLDNSNQQIILLNQKNNSLQNTVQNLNNQINANRQVIEQLEITVLDRENKIKNDQKIISEQKRELVILNNNIKSLNALKDNLERKISQLDKQLISRNDDIVKEKEISIQARAQATFMSQQLEVLRNELNRLSQILDTSDALSKEQKAQISDLGKRMNRALASKVQELQRYRSEFFARLRNILGSRPGVRIVGDRFVFQSEVLFQSGSAELGTEGKIQLQQLAETLLEISKEIPQELNWILRIDGHTDNVPIKTNKFPSNWELSTARAISVVKFIVEQGIPENRLVAAGFGEFQPLDNNETSLARRKNRRIELKFDQK
ncbi:MAG: peptidoglycan -binding protein [Pseudomonadota bacterium]|nr:peptidoglycan -binding protein [Pseudomonadota bacterium]